MIVPHCPATSSARITSPPSVPMIVATSSGLHARHIGHIHHQLIHAHSPHHRTARSVKQYLSPLLGQAARQAVGIADGNHCQPPHLIRPKGQAVSCSLAGQEGAHRSYPGAQGKHWVQIQLSFCVGIIAEDTVKGDSCPCPGTWLRRQIPDAVACLDVDCSVSRPWVLSHRTVA